MKIKTIATWRFALFKFALQRSFYFNPISERI